MAIIEGLLKYHYQNPLIETEIPLQNSQPHLLRLMPMVALNRVFQPKRHSCIIYSVKRFEIFLPLTIYTTFLLLNFSSVSIYSLYLLLFLTNRSMHFENTTCFNEIN